MKVPQFYIKSDAAGDMFEVTHAERFRRAGEHFQYSDEAKEAQTEIDRLVKRLPPRPERPPRDVVPEKATEKQRAKAQDAYMKAWNAWRAADEAWIATHGNPLRERVRAKWEKKFAARVGAMPPGMVRVEVGPGGPVMARNLPKRLRRVGDVDAKALDRLDRRIAALQIERARLILGAWERGATASPEHIVATADATKRVRDRYALPLTRQDLDGVHMVTAHAVEKRAGGLA